MRTKEESLSKCPVCGQELNEDTIGPRDYSTWAFAHLPKRMGGTDVDRVVERHGHFLAWEFKPNKYIPTGQRIFFNALAKQGQWTVYVCVDKNHKDDTYEVGRWVPGEGVNTWWTMTAEQMAELEVMWLEEVELTT